jgi:hypothetical protein
MKHERVTTKSREDKRPKGASRKWRRMAVVGAAGFLAAFVVGLTGQTASAGFVNSATGYYGPVFGYNYTNYATIYTLTSGAGQAIAYTAAGPTGATAPSGYVGVKGRLWTSGNTLACQGAVNYSSQPLTAGSYWTANSCTKVSHGAWHSNGLSYAFNGSGYDPYTTFNTVNQNS